MGFVGSRDERARPAYFTPWASIHLRSGILMYLFFSILKLPPMQNFAVSLTLHTIYELKDIFIKRYTVENSIGDTIAFMVGFWISAMILEGMPMKKELFLFIGMLTLMSVCIYEVESLG